jgi:hypothetical protein
VIAVKPAFEADRLTDDFLATLKSGGLISRAELREYGDHVASLVELYAVAAMHNCMVQVGDGSTVQLKGGVHGESLQILAGVPGAWPASPDVITAAPIFSVSADAAIHCHPDLQARDSWDFEIELAPDKRLAPLR